MEPARLDRVADALVGGIGAADGSTLDRLLRTTTELVGVSGASVAIVTEGEHRGTVAMSDPSTGAVDELQFSLGEGPCIDAGTSLGPVLEQDLADAQDQWPAFAPAALTLDCHAAFAFPLRIGAVRVGVLGLYRSVPGELGRRDLDDAVTLATVATHLLLAMEDDLDPGALPDRLVDVLQHRRVDFMTLLTVRCVELLGATEAGVLLADPGSTLRSVASSHEAARLLDLYELQAEEGPCLDCYRTGQAIVNHQLAGDDQPWPLFSARARSLGFDTVHALPLRLRGEVIGAMNVFTTGEQHLDHPSIAVGQALADVATIGLLHQRSIREATRLSEQLQAALTSRVVIEQAKGMLAEREGVDMDRAFDVLRTYSQTTNQKLSAVAQMLLDRTLRTEDLRPADMP